MKSGMLNVLAACFLIALTFNAQAGLEPSPFRPKINKLGAVTNNLNSIHKRVIKILSRPPETKARCPDLKGVVNRLDAMEKKLIRSDVLLISLVEEVLDSSPDDMYEDILPALTEVKDAARGISESINTYLVTPPVNIVPLEFISAFVTVQKAAKDIAITASYYIDVISGWNQTFTLTIEMGGTGSGRVSSLPTGIFCETDCSEDYVSATQVTLTATPYSGSVFSGWSGGGCSGIGSCTLSMAGDTSITARFTLSSTVLSNLITPYVNESDMLEIFDLFNSQYGLPPLNRVHDGFDIYPKDNLKPFQALCSGRVKEMFVGDEQVIVWLECNSTFTAEYNFESQALQTGQTQLSNITVAKGQLVSQGDIIGYLYAPNENAHVHFSLFKNWTPVCPEPYFSLAAQSSMLNLINTALPGAGMCYGGDPTQTPLVTPYVNESDMTQINPGFSDDYTTSPWNFVHKGMDIYPQGNLKPFQAACSGVVDTVLLQYDAFGSNYQVKVLIECDDYVFDPEDGGYFIPYTVNYLFETMSTSQADGQTQLNNIMVVDGQPVNQGDVIGNLYAPNLDAHLHFGVVQYGSSFFSQFGVSGIPLCPAPYFSTTAKDSILDLLHKVWPSANMCY